MYNTFCHHLLGLNDTCLDYYSVFAYFPALLIVHSSTLAINSLGRQAVKMQPWHYSCLPKKAHTRMKSPPERSIAETWGEWSPASHIIKARIFFEFIIYVTR